MDALKSIAVGLVALATLTAIVLLFGRAVVFITEHQLVGLVLLVVGVTSLSWVVGDGIRNG